VRAHVPAAFCAFADAWQSIFREGVCDHSIKELCRVYISRTVKCEFCGNQRSMKAAKAGLEEMQYDELLNFETSDTYDERQKAALSYAQAIAWGEQNLDGLWERLRAQFSEEELVELGNFIALTFGQQSWIRLLGIDHHQYMAGTDAAMAPGFRSAEELAESKAKDEYWARL
jgi:alkylhydroperoxidase family enzyme